MKNNISYYSHDISSHSHWKFKSLRKKYGWAGEGRFWVLQNIIASKDKCILYINNNTIEELSKVLEMAIKDVWEFIYFLLYDIKILIDAGEGISTELLQKEYAKFFKINFTRLYNVDIKLWKRICKEVFIRDNYTCTYCKNIGGILECDHITPISKGGSNDMGNLTTSCQKCNRQKKDKTVDEFNAWRADRI